MLYVNCWHVSNHESEAMWRIYCGGDNGLAIVLPYEDLRTSVSMGTAWIGMVGYLDFELDLLAPPTLSGPRFISAASLPTNRKRDSKLR